MYCWKPVSTLSEARHLKWYRITMRIFNRHWKADYHMEPRTQKNGKNWVQKICSEDIVEVSLWRQIWQRKSTLVKICQVHRPNTANTNYTHTHTRLMALFPGLPRWAGTRKVKPIWILLKQDTVSGSGISWAICMSASCSRQITMPAPHHSSFFTGRMPFLPPNQQRQSTEGITANTN